MKLFTLSMGLALVTTSSLAQAGAVVVAKDSPIETLSSEQVRRIFLGSDSVASGVKLTLVVQRNETVRADFERKVLDMTGPAVEAYWVKQIFTGKAAPPKEVSSDAEVLTAVAHTPAAIGYVSDSAIDSSVKVVFRY